VKQNLAVYCKWLTGNCGAKIGCKGRVVERDLWCEIWMYKRVADRELWSESWIYRTSV